MRSLLIASILFTGCVDADEDLALDETSSDLGIGPTVLTFFESSNATGASLAVSLGATTNFEATKLVSKPDVTTAGLLGKISAVRLKCGARDARVVLFDAYNASNTSFSSWSHLGGQGGTINCTSGTTKTINLHTSMPNLADRVASALLVTHAQDVDSTNWSDFLESAWATALDELPSEATPTKTQFWLSTTRRFEIRQYLDIDHWACTKRGAVFEYSVLMHDDGTFSASVVDSYVDYGFGDSWGCRDKMKATLDKSIADARDDLEGGMHTLLTFLAGDHERYYFAPDVHLTSFDLFFGADPLVNAPL